MTGTGCKSTRCCPERGVDIRTRLIQLVAGCALSALAVFLLLQQVSLDQLADVLRRARPLPVALLVAAVLASLLTRAARWQVYFLPDERLPFRPLLSTLSISYMASTFLPFRAGELVRAVFLGQRQSQALPRVVGTILLEKLFDFLAIGVMLALLVATTPLPGLALVVGSSIASVILLGFGGVVALAVWRAPTLRLVRLVEAWLPAGVRARLGLLRAARQFAEGTDALRVPRLWVPMLGWTALTWAFSIAAGWAGGQAVDLPLGLAAATFLAVVTSSGQAVPSSPGYFGVYHAAAVLALAAFGVDQATALGVAVLTHAFSYGSLVVAGLVALWLDGYGLADLVKKPPAARREPAAVRCQPSQG